MRKNTRKNLTIFILAFNVGLLPLLNLRSTTGFHSAMATNMEISQEKELDDDSIVCNDIYENCNQQSSLTASDLSTEQVSGTTWETTNSNQEKTNTTQEVSSTTQEESSTSQEVPSTTQEESSTAQEISKTTETDEYCGLDRDEYYWLCKIVMAEVGYCSYRSQQAIASVVINRVNCWYFPDTYYDVIMQPGQFYDGPPTIWDANVDTEDHRRPVTEEDITDSVKAAVNSALTDGVDYANGAFYEIGPKYMDEDLVNYFYELYGEPCLELEEGLFFTVDLCDSHEEWLAKYVTGE